jgi:ferrous iron transport protein A
MLLSEPIGQSASFASAGASVMIAGRGDLLTLAQLPRGVAATVSAVRPAATQSDQPLVQRLTEIGFIPGERVTVIAHGHPGREPIAVRVGSSTFALRRFEAEHIEVVVDISAAPNL